jgi:hypothetical protein
MHCSKQHRYSITSSARASSVGGMVIPSAIAVLRSNSAIAVIGIDIGKNSFHVVGLTDGQAQSTDCPNTPVRLLGCRRSIAIRKSKADLIAT